MAKKGGEGKGVAEQLREAIRACGKSLSQLGADAGVDSGTLSRFMRGKRELGINNVEKLCVVLGLRLAPGEQN